MPAHHRPEQVGFSRTFSRTRLIGACSSLSRVWTRPGGNADFNLGVYLDLSVYFGIHMDGEPGYGLDSKRKLLTCKD